MGGIASAPSHPRPGDERQAIVFLFQRAVFWGHVAVVAGYAASIPQQINSHLPDGLRMLLQRVRPGYVLLYILGLASFMLLARLAKPRGVTRPNEVNLVAKLSLVFPLFYLVFLPSREDSSGSVFALYLLWAVMTFWLAPRLAENELFLRRLAQAFLVCFGINWIWPMVYTWLTGQSAESIPGRISYGYSNPNLFAQLPQMAVTMLSYLLMQRIRRGDRVRMRHKVILVAALALALWCVWFARARNVLLFGAAFTLAYFLLMRGRKGLLGLAALFALTGAFVAISVVTVRDSSDLDELSSSRTKLWRHTFTFVVNEGVFAMATGPDHLPGAELLRSYDDLKDEESYSKFRIDNLFLELFVERGAIGVMLFFLPYLLTLLYAVKRRLEAPEDPLRLWSLAFLVAITFQSLVIATVPTFATPLGWTFAFFGIGPILAGGKRGQATFPEQSPEK